MSFSVVSGFQTRRYGKLSSNQFIYLGYFYVLKQPIGIIIGSISVLAQIFGKFTVFLMFFMNHADDKGYLIRL
jgi:hypothetical protein